MKTGEKVAWVGGLFEGEGCWHWDGEKITARVVMCDENVIRQAADWAGIGAVYGPHPASGLGTKDRWTWNVSSTTDAYALYLGIELFLGARRRARFQDLLQTWTSASSSRLGRPAEWEMRKLRRQGARVNDLAEQFGVSPSRVSQVCRRPTWSCYVSGKMRGLPLFGFPAFDAARDSLLGRGWEVVSPADLDRAAGFDVKADYDFHIVQGLKRDFDAVRAVDAVVLLPNWEDSVGARAEKLVGERFGRKIFTLEEALGE